MNATSLGDLFQPTRGRQGAGVLGLVDELLAYCRDRQVRITWESGAVTARPLAGGVDERAPVPFRGSVFRAVLARLAALCDGGSPVSPYGGRGEFVDEGPPPTTFRLDFSNTPDDQRLDLTPVVEPAPAHAPADAAAARR